MKHTVPDQVKKITHSDGYQNRRCEWNRLLLRDNLFSWRTENFSG